MQQPGTQPPIFNGLDLIKRPVTEFILGFIKFTALNAVPMNRWAIILDTLINEPARTRYQAALGGNGIRADQDAALMAAGAQAVEFQDRYTARRDWLLAQYNSQVQQEEAREVLMEMNQGVTEDPRTFYSRIITQANGAAYDPAFIPIIARQVFMRGIHREIRTKMAEQPRLGLEDSVDLANRIWQNSHHAITQEVTLFPQQQE